MTKDIENLLNRLEGIGVAGARDALDYINNSMGNSLLWDMLTEIIGSVNAGLDILSSNRGGGFIVVRFNETGGAEEYIPFESLKAAEDRALGDALPGGFNEVFTNDDDNLPVYMGTDIREGSDHSSAKECWNDLLIDFPSLPINHEDRYKIVSARLSAYGDIVDAINSAGVTEFMSCNGTPAAYKIADALVTYQVLDNIIDAHGFGSRSLIVSSTGQRT